MARRKEPEELPPPHLLVPVADARARLLERLEKGQTIRAVDINTEDELKRQRHQFKIWDDFNTELLRRLFTNASVADEYSSYSGVGFIALDTDLWDWIADFGRDLDARLGRLESIIERLDLFAPAAASPSPRPLPASDQASVFIVHGRDEAAKQTVARFLEHLGVRPVILHEQPNQGRTLIEKFEAHAGVAVAVVLLTPDDVGGLSDSTLRPRARQNVIFELGFFVAALGRNRVCALYAGDVELPSDYQGIAYVQLDRANGWQLPLARELKAAGIAIDLNRAI